LPSSTGASTSSRTATPVFVVTGPSGAGKGTLIKLVLPRFPALALAVSATTRPRRPGEQDGVDYWFLEREEFDRRIGAGSFLEWVDYVGNRYGTLQTEIDRLREQGRSPMLELETDGALRVSERVPGAVTIFVTAPVEELERRLRERATESSGEIGERIATARGQLELQPIFDHVVTNVDRERAADELAAVIAPALAATATMSHHDPSPHR
jgi:guanylate kinase